jgi:hypothetical protein
MPTGGGTAIALVTQTRSLEPDNLLKSPKIGGFRGQILLLEKSVLKLLLNHNLIILNTIHFKPSSPLAPNIGGK